MANVGLIASPSLMLPSELDLASQRRQLWLVTCSFAIYTLGMPFVSLVHVSSLAARSEGGGAHIRLHALAFGAPLLAALLSRNSLRGFRITFPGSSWLDTLAVLMFVYWFGEGIHGLAAGNGARFVISNGFNFSVPMLCYFAMRNLDYPGLIDEAGRRFLTICLWSAVPNLLVTLYASAFMGFVGSGGVAHLLPLAAAAVALLDRRHATGVLVMGAALVTIVASLKRSIWGAVFVFPVFYLFIIQRTQHIVKFVMLGLMMFAFMLVFDDYLPDRLNVDSLASRFQSIHLETQGFRSGQARQDEFVGIWEEVVENGTWTSVLFGKGIGASYTNYMSTTHRIVIYNYRNSHFTPMGWFLRGGLIGLALNMAFYGCAIASAIRCVRCSDPGARVWQGALAAYFVLAVMLSATAFSLTPNAATHMALMVVVLRPAALRREHVFGEPTV